MEPVVFATGSSTGGPYFANIEIGKDLGFYAEEGIDPEFLHAGGNAQATAELEAGRARFAVGTPNFQVNYYADEGAAPGVNILEYTYPMKWDFIVPPDSDIQQLQDLEGKTLGIVRIGTADEQVARQWLGLADVDPDTVDMVVTGGGMPAGTAMQDGEVDALLAWGTHRGQYDVEGIEYRLLDRPEGVDNFGGFFIQTHRDVLESDQDLAVGFARAVVKGAVFALENPHAAMAIYLDNHPEVGEGLDREEAVERLVASLQHRMSNWKPYDDGAMQGEINPDEWVNEIAFAGLSDQIDDPSVFFTNELVEEANDFDHEAIKQLARDYDWQSGS